MHSNTCKQHHETEIGSEKLVAQKKIYKLIRFDNKTH